MRSSRPFRAFAEVRPSIRSRQPSLSGTYEMVAHGLTRFLHPLPGRFLAALLLFFLGQGIAGPAAAHELHHRLTRAEAVTVQFYDTGDHRPVGELYEVFAPGSETPLQTGRINARGEVTFLPGTAGEWLVRVVTANGHGAEVRLNLDAVGEASWKEGHPSSRVERILAALGYLFGLFGLLAIWRVRATRRRKR